MEPKRYRLLGPDGFYFSDAPGQLGGTRHGKLHERLDCPSALNALPKVGDKDGVFIADKDVAIKCGYRP